MLARSRTPAVMADAAHAILSRPARQCTGQFFIDDAVLYDEGVRDFEPYSVTPGSVLFADLFVDRASPVPPGVKLEFMM
jgi:citronellol/citronellal dehydrogenase